MGRIESIRLAPRRSQARAGSVNGSGDGSAAVAAELVTGTLVSGVDPDALLEVLAAGDPPAFATDSRDCIVFWNRGMANLLGRRSDEALGRRCYETVAGRDVFGNWFCYANCPVTATLREGDPVCGFELKVPISGSACRAVGVTILKIPGVRPDLFTLVHIFQPIPEEGRLARMLERLAAPSASGRAGTRPPLTRRETEILHYVAAGLQNKEVAQKLDLSLATVRNHVHNIVHKLGVHSKLEAVSLSFRNGWVPSEFGAPPAVRPAVPPPVGAEES
jgi:DNA-binding CsgD family transcriptional regulator/PAS domain-containing protein